MSGNPYEDGETSPEDANTDLLAEMRGNIEDGGNPEEPEDDADVIIVGDPVEEEPVEAGGQSRDEKRRERGRRWKEEQASQSDANAKLREELAEVRGQINAIQSQSVQQQPGERRDPYEDRRAQVRDAQRSTIREYQKIARRAQSEKRELTQEEEKSFLDRNEAHSKDMTFIHMDEHRAQSNTPADRARTQLSAMYPDVMDGGNAERYAKALYETKRIRGEITPDNDGEQTKLVMQQTRKDLKLAGHDVPPPANAKQRSSYGSLRSTGSSRPSSNQMRFAKDSPERAMAIGLYNHMPGWTDKQKLQAFVNSEKKGG